MKFVFDDSESVWVLLFEPEVVKHQNGFHCEGYDQPNQFPSYVFLLNLVL